MLKYFLFFIERNGGKVTKTIIEVLKIQEIRMKSEENESLRDEIQELASENRKLKKIIEDQELVIVKLENSIGDLKRQGTDVFDLYFDIMDEEKNGN